MIELSLEPLRMISGQVVDDSAQPIGDALIMAVGSRYLDLVGRLNDPKEIDASILTPAVHSDAGGRFSISVPSWATSLAASAYGHVPVEHALPAEGQEATVQLTLAVVYWAGCLLIDGESSEQLTLADVVLEGTDVPIRIYQGSDLGSVLNGGAAAAAPSTKSQWLFVKNESADALSPRVPHLASVLARSPGYSSKRVPLTVWPWKAGIQEKASVIELEREAGLGEVRLAVDWGMVLPPRHIRVLVRRDDGALMDEMADGVKDGAFNLQVRDGEAICNLPAGVYDIRIQADEALLAWPGSVLGKQLAQRVFVQEDGVAHAKFDCQLLAYEVAIVGPHGEPLPSARVDVYRLPRAAMLTTVLVDEALAAPRYAHYRSIVGLPEDARTVLRFLLPPGQYKFVARHPELGAAAADAAGSTEEPPARVVLKCGSPN